MEISIVVPVLNEKENIPALCERIISALSQVTSDFEILFVDDGSRDGSIELLQEAHAGDPRIRALVFSRRFGHQAALTAGLDHAQGQAVVTMDGDLQHPPEVILAMFRQWKNGFEIVHAIRSDHPGEPPLKSLTSRAFYWIFNKMSGVTLPPHAGEFRLLDRKVVASLKRFRERGRLLRGLSSWVGYRTAQVEYAAGPRERGLSKYSVVDMLALAADGIISFSSIPLFMGVWAGFALGIVTLGYVAFALYARFISHAVIPGWTSIAVLIGGVGSVQLLVMGLIGIYAGKIYEEVKQRPLYLIQGTIGVDDPAA